MTYPKAGGNIVWPKEWSFDPEPLAQWLNKLPADTGTEIHTTGDDGKPVTARKTDDGWEIETK